ncbi:MAG TPA: hypothetical protein VKS21_05835 [Spirochaetota bacterium]|nr:hypothetical protein [Spirochaetota bacterium]
MSRSNLFLMWHNNIYWFNDSLMMGEFGYMPPCTISIGLGHVEDSSYKADTVININNKLQTEMKNKQTYAKLYMKTDLNMSESLAYADKQYIYLQNNGRYSNVLCCLQPVAGYRFEKAKKLDASIHFIIEERSTISKILKSYFKKAVPEETVNKLIRSADVNGFQQAVIREASFV